jgi:hypothetical protein
MRFVIDVDHHAGQETPGELEDLVARDGDAARGPAHVGARGVDE